MPELAAAVSTSAAVPGLPASTAAAAGMRLPEPWQLQLPWGLATAAAGLGTTAACLAAGVGRLQCRHRGELVLHHVIYGYIAAYLLSVLVLVLCALLANEPIWCLDNPANLGAIRGLYVVKIFVVFMSKCKR